MMVQRTNVDGLTYSRWLIQVELLLMAKRGITTQDLQEFDHYAAWYIERKPEEWVDRLLKVHDSEPPILVGGVRV